MVVAILVLRPASALSRGGSGKRCNCRTLAFERWNQVQSNHSALFGYKQAFGQRATRRFLELKFGHLPQIATLRCMTALAAIYYNGEAGAEGAQVRLLRELAGKAGWVDRVAAELGRDNWILFHDELFAGMAKMALRFSPRDDRAVPDDFGSRIAECALMYNELLGNELLPEVLTGTVEDLLRSDLRSLPRHSDNRFGIVGRYVRFIEWMKSEESIKYKWTRSIEDDFASFYGISASEYLSACVLIGTLYSGIRNVELAKVIDPIIDVQRWFQTLRDGAFLRTFLERFSISAEDLVAEWGAASSESLSLAALGPLWNRPLIRLDERHVVAPLPALLFNATGEGFYYNLFDRYDEETKGRLSQCFGYFLQDYVREIFDAAYVGRSDCAVDGDLPYGKHGGERTTDTVIFEGDDVIFVEVVGKRVNRKGAILDLDEKAIRDVLDAGVGKKLKSLDTNVKAYREGKTFRDRPRPEGQRIFAVIVTPVPYPHLYVKLKYIPASIAREGWLRDGVASVEIADIEEVEMLEDAIPGGLRLAAFLQQKAEMAPNISIRNVLIQCGEAGRGQPSIARGARFVETVAERLRK